MAPEPEPHLEPESHPEPQAQLEPQPQPGPAADAAITAAPEPPLTEPQSPPADRQPTPPKRLPRTAPAPGYIPAWLVAPVLRIAIPDSPFGRGGPGRPIGEEEPPSRSAEPATVGFAKVEALAAAEPPSQAVEPVVAAVGEPASASEQVPASPEKPAETPYAQASPAMEPGDAERAEVAAAVSASPASKTAEPPPAAEAPSAESAPREPETEVSEGPSEAPAPLRAARPLGAPQSASRRTPAPEAEAAGLPAVDVPPLVEPEAEPSEATDTAVGPTRDDRPTIRNRRLYRRVSIDAEFEIDGTAAKLLDLSMGGFAAANAPRLAPNAVVPVTVRLAIDGVDISTRMRARMVYAETPRSGGRFIDLTAGQTAFLRYVVTWRGQSVGALGTATLLEAIGHTPDPFRPAEPPALEPPGRAEQRTAWWTRLFGWFRARGTPE